MSHTIQKQYDLIAGDDALVADFNAMLNWIDHRDMSPCDSVHFGEAVNSILVHHWIDFRNSLSNTSNRYDRQILENLARNKCDSFEFFEVENRIIKLPDSQLMAIARLFDEDILIEIDDSQGLVSQIEVIWQIGDVQSIRPDLSDQQASEVLLYADRCHDAELGINWDVLRIHAEHLFPEDEQLSGLEVVDSRYADSIIGGDPTKYDAIEVHGVRNLNDPEDPDGTHYEVDDENPELFSVYVHYISGGIDCVGDFSLLSQAMEYASELSVRYQWSVSGFVSEDS